MCCCVLLMQYVRFGLIYIFHSVPSILRLWHYYYTGVMGFQQDNSQASLYLDQLEELLNEGEIQEMKLALIDDLKLLKGNL